MRKPKTPGYLAAAIDTMPVSARRKLEPVLETLQLLRQIRSPAVMTGMLPSFGRGFVLKLGELDVTKMVSGHAAHFDWNYRSDFPEMRELYKRAKQNQWDSDVHLDWSIDVDPMNPEVPLLPKEFFDMGRVRAHGLKLSASEQTHLLRDATAWMLSQFLHGEQGALYAAAQVTESVTWHDGVLYGSTQVVDEGRHVEVFHRYIDEKLGKLYIINDNLFTIIDSLMSDSRWDMKFLGMQIMVEGLALGAFSMMYRNTKEPLLKELLSYVIKDEARHVHYGVLALRDHIREHLSDKERREREEWVFEIALLMQNRFMLYEIHEEWFEHKISRRKWREIVSDMPGLNEFRSVMFTRLVPNLKYIGLLPDRMLKHYEQAGLAKYMNGRNASELSAEDVLSDLDHSQAPVGEGLGLAFA